MGDHSAETEPFLPKPMGYQSEEPQLSPEELTERNHYLDIGISIAVPWVLFTFLLVLFMFYHDVKFLVWLYIYSCLAGAVVMMCLGGAARHGLFFLLGLTTLVSVIIGINVGFYIDSEYLEYYEAVNGGITYNNVDPTSQASAKVDAGVLDFSNTSFVDDWRTIGYVIDGSIHCIAPVTKETAQSKEIQYWATGVNCCEKRSHFDCGSAMESHTKKAIVAKKSKYWSKAVAEATSVYNLTSSSEARFLTFVDDPSDAQDDIWADAVFIALMADILHLCAMSAAVFLVFEAMPASMSPKGGEEFVSYYASRIWPNLSKHGSNVSNGLDNHRRRMMAPSRGEYSDADHV